MKFKDSLAIISGGASGMGEATARLLINSGATVAILDTNEKALSKLSDEIGTYPIVCDVTNAEDVESSVDRVYKKYGSPQICVTCAGIAPAARIVGKEGPMPLDDFTRVIQVNLIGTFNVMRIVAAAMMKKEPSDKHGERGVIISTASIAAYEGQIGQAAYSASKGGVVALTLPAAREFAKFGIRVNCIAPGLMDTPMMAGMPEEVRQDLANTVPFPKRLGRPDEYAKLAAHIVENELINGEVIRLDGALRMQAK